MSCDDLYLKGKLYLYRGLLVASQAAEGQGIRCVLRSDFRYSSCVSGCWEKPRGSSVESGPEYLGSMYVCGAGKGVKLRDG